MDGVNAPAVKTRRRVMIVTGEASGDLHGSKLIAAAHQVDQRLEFFGAGGRKMAEAGCEILVCGDDIAVMGLVEVLGHFSAIRQAFKRLSAELRGERRPDALVLIDFPEFNLRLAKVAKAAGIPVLYYVSPQVWAWRKGRVKKIAGVVDALAAIFPFEPELYRGLDIRVEYVGHPLLDEVRITLTREQYLREYSIDGCWPVIGIFPGSRRSELRYNLEVMLDAAALLKERYPEVAFLLPLAPGLDRAAIATKLRARSLPVTLVDGSIYDTANACDAVLAVSGTVTLQIALTGTPMAIVYRMASLTYAIGKRLVKVPFIGLVNIVAGRGVVREFIQHAATAANLAAEIGKILDDRAYAARIRSDLEIVQKKLGEPGCSARVAGMLAGLLSRNS